MATLNRTFSVRNGIDVANTIIVDANRNISNIPNANITTANIATLNVNAAGALAVVANATINNTAITNAQITFLNVTTQANSLASNIVTANIATLNVNAPGATANIATANIINLYSSTANVHTINANTIITTEGLNLIDQANAAANLVAVYANDSLVIANANVNFNNSESINVSATIHNTAKAANIDFSLNTASITSVGRPTAPLTLASNVTVDKDLTVTGNLFILGNTTTVNTETLVVEDSLIKLASNNTSDAVDIGFYGLYNTNFKAGLYRDSSDGKFKLFRDYQGDLTANVIVGSTNSATLIANVEAALINVTTANISALEVTTSAELEKINVATTANVGTTLEVGGNVNLYANLNVTNNVVMSQNANVTGTLNVGSVSDFGAKVTITTAGEGLEVANANVTSYLTVGTLNVTTNTVVTSSSGQVVLDTFATTDHASAKYFVQANSGSDFTTTEVILVQDGTNVWLTEYGTLQTGPSLGIFSADINSGDVRLLFTANNNVNTIRSVRYGVLVP
jgi:hypothetical protein